MHLRQTEKYGCGVYAVANALQNENFITDRRLEASRDGNNIGQLTSWLLGTLNIWIKVLAYNNEEPIDAFDLNPQWELDESEEKEALFVPFFLVVKSTKTKNHMLGCRYMRDGRIIVHDSLLPSPQVFPNFQEFKEKFDKKILSYECLATIEGAAVVMIRWKNN